MIKLVFIFSTLFAVHATTIPTENSNHPNSECELTLLEASIFKNVSVDIHTELDGSTIQLYEIEEEVELGFNTKNYLPKEFNPLKGLHDLDLSAIILFEIEEEVNLGFDSKNYLPKGFNPLKGLHNLDLSAIILFEIEEEVNLGFDSKNYLPKGFNPLKG